MEKSVHSLGIAESPLSRVTVFSDRAEITRKIELKCDVIARSGSHSIVVKGLSPYVIEDSVRVKGLGRCIIEEVAVERTSVELEELKGDNEEIGSLLQKMEDVLRRMDENKAEEAVLRRQGEFIDQYIESMLTGGGKHGVSPLDGFTGGPAAVVQQEGVSKVESLLEYHQSRMPKIRSKQFELKVALDKLEGELGAIKTRLDKLIPGIPPAQEREKLMNFVRNVQQQQNAKLPIARPPAQLRRRTAVSILLTIDDAGLQQHRSSSTSFTFEVSYIVTNARWSPSYDCRITTMEKAIKLSYFGVVSQSTEEDWNDVELLLSTAQPAVGGTPPHLPTKHVNFEALPRPVMLKSKMTKAGSRGAGSRSSMAMTRNAAPEEEEMDFDVCDSATTEAVHRMVEVTSPAGAANATYRIQRSCTVESDNKPHKVTVAMLDLESKFRHYAVPSICSNMFLQAKTKNSSDIALLPSKNVSIFLDGTFLAKTSLEAVAPGETFSSFLGVDPSVRIEAHNETRKKKEGGFLQKFARYEVNCNTVIYNTKPSTGITLVVVQQLPLSSDDKITVKMTDPLPDTLLTASSSKDSSAVDELPIGNEDDVVIFNKPTNNVLWRRKIPPAGKSKINFSYQIESPADKVITKV